MTPGPEFLDADGAAASGGQPQEHPGDELDVGRAHRLGPVGRVGTIAVAAAALVAAAVMTVPQDRVVRGSGSAVLAPAVIGAGLPPAAASVRELAGTHGRLTDYARQTAAAGACPAVRVGASPTRAIAARVGAALPDFRITDVASTLDEFGELCSVRLRARTPHGVVLALIITAPGTASTPVAPFVRLRTGTDTAADGSVVVWVSATSVRHWKLVMGAVGGLSGLPSSTELQRLAQQGELTW